MEDRRIPGKGFRERKEKRLGFKNASMGKCQVCTDKYIEIFFFFF